MAKPCRLCLREIKKAGIHKVTYSGENGELITEKVAQMSSDYVCSGEKLFDYHC